MRILIILFLTFYIFFSFYGHAIVPSISMYPTFAIRECLLYNHNQNLNYGDIALFSPFKDKKIVLVKRVIGKSGDTIEMKDGQVFRNGKIIEENYILESPNYIMNSIRVPDNHYFMLGDNRNHSYDSHIIGTIPKDRFIGKVIFHFRIFPDLNLPSA